MAFLSKMLSYKLTDSDIVVWAFLVCYQGRIKSRAVGQSCGKILADFVQKRAENGPHFLKLVFLLLFSLILCKSKKYYTFPRHVDTNNKIFIGPKVFKVKFRKGPDFFHSVRTFPPDWPERFARNWQHCVLRVVST